MIIVTEYTKYEYELKRLCNLFFPWEKHSLSPTPPQNGDYLTLSEITGEDMIVFNFTLSLRGNFYPYTATSPLPHPEHMNHKLILSSHIYKLLKQATGINPKWGILTGVRPISLYSKFYEIGGDELAMTELVQNRLVAKEKYDLAAKAYELQKGILAKNTPKSFSLYIGIPFCPTRCSYCSFVSHSISSAKELIQPYVERLISEIEYTGKMADKIGLKLLSVYIGGGTPTSISASQLNRIMRAVSENFDLSGCMEYTVEAGRPDTVDAEKFTVIRENNASRISINPQSFNDEVLKAIGRNHSAEDIIEKFELARKCGLKNINMDIIAGLPKDDIKSFTNTMQTAINLAPENITVHTLSLKKASFLGEGEAEEIIKSGELAAEMVQYSQRALAENCYLPYYIYRQQNTVGNLENTGYTRIGYEGLYNVYMMEECHTILSCGAGAGSKLLPSEGVIKRVFNHKYPYEYVNNFDEVMEKKRQIERIYRENLGFSVD